MKNSRNKRRLQILLIALVAVLTLGIGYASITAVNLIINGNATANVNQNNFQVYFVNTENTPNLTGNVTVTGSANIDNQDSTIATFNVGGLTKLGDYAIATYTILNNSNAIGAELSLNVTNINNEYFKVTETVTDSQLQAGDTTTATVKVELINTPPEQDVSTSITARLTASPLENAQATGNSSASKVAGDPESFATDSWATIQKAVRNNNTSLYNVGDTKEVTINNTDYTVRIANKTTGEHCGDEDTTYSQTACGFVVEFVDCITTMKMRDSNNNDGGYPATLVYDYLNNILPSQLSSELQSAIKPTRVISGHGLGDSTNFTSTNQKLYLLSGEEVWGTDAGGHNLYDAAVGTSHQLEYYSNNSVSYETSNWTGTNLDKAIKQYNSSNIRWWLRQAPSNDVANFAAVGFDGGWYDNYATNTFGVVPAFRIG